MKKTLIALLLTGLLAGCSTQQTSNTDQASDKTSTSQSEKSSSSDKSKNKDTSSSSESSSSTSTDKSEDAYAKLTDAIKAKDANLWLPKTIVTDAAHVNAVMTTADQTTTVKFYGSDTAADLNTAQEGSPIYTLTKTTYANKDEALSNINWQETEDGLPTVDLGDKQTATKEGAAGSTYLHWNEGNWSLTVRASNVNDEDPTDLGKSLVELFRTKSLPAPSDKGAVSFLVGDSEGGQSIVWNDGASVYTFTGTNALKTAQTAVR